MVTSTFCPSWRRHVERRRLTFSVKLCKSSLWRRMCRRDFEELSDCEPRFKAMIRRLDKALKESGAEGKMPSEVYGWYLVNNYMRMEPSDVANIRGRSESYKHTDILAALHRMWSGGGLAAKDSETKKKKKESNGHAMVMEDEDMVEEEVFLANEDDERAFIDDPEDDEVLANFRDARQALGQARTSRGFYPVKDPNLNRGSGFATSKGRGKGRGFNRDNQQYRELPGCLSRGSCFSLGSRRSCSRLRRRRLIITTHHKPTYHITTSHHNSSQLITTHHTLSHTKSSQLHFSHLTHHSSTAHNNSSQLHFWKVHFSSQLITTYHIPTHHSSTSHTPSHTSLITSELIAAPLLAPVITSPLLTPQFSHLSSHTSPNFTLTLDT